MAKPELSGTYHAVAAGETSWHGYAQHVVDFARGRGEALRVGADAIAPIPSSAYAQAAPRPKNSRLDTTKLRAAFDVVLPPWQQGVDRMLTEFLERKDAA
jgi:dTDP-4-dehydrorhamnose reductase